MENNLFILWLTISAILVASMQVGFLFIEAGFVRSKNSINVAMKNLVDFAFAIVTFMVIGSAFMFGTSANGIFGWSSDMVGWSNVTTDQLLMLFFQAMFCGTAATILSGAIAERMKFSAYLIIIIPLTALIYPIIGHWAWGSYILGSDNQGWLQSIGFVDAAGGTVVHVTGGMASLALVIALGARAGRFDDITGKSVKIQGYSPILAASGALILFMGWIGFNSGGLTPGSDNFTYAIVNTCLSGVSGAIAAMVIARYYDGYYRSDRTINGLITGLVAITASAPFAMPITAMIVGSLAALVMIISSEWLERKWKLDDAISAISVHGVVGMMGTILVPLLARNGAFDRPIAEHIAIQTLGTMSVAIFTFASVYIFARLFMFVTPLRISQEDEAIGLNRAEHGTAIGAAGLENTLQQLNLGEADLQSRVMVNDFEEGADVAIAFNAFLSKMQKSEMAARARISQEQAQRAEQEQLIYKEIATKEERKAKQLAKTLNHFQSEFGTLVTHLQNHSSALAREAKSLNRRMLQSDAEIEEAGNASDQSAIIASHVATAIDRLSDSLDAMARDIETASHSADQAAIASNEGRKAAVALEQGAQSIAKLITAIAAISQRSNIVAVNAQIEANHAGAEGSSFAVVANEISVLAKQTRDASTSVAQIVNDVGILIGEAVARFKIIDQEVEAVSSSNNHARIVSHQQLAQASQIRSMVNESAQLSGKAGSAVIEASANISATSKASAALDDTATDLLNLAQQLEHSFDALSQSLDQQHHNKHQKAA